MARLAEKHIPTETSPKMSSAVQGSPKSSGVSPTSPSKGKTFGAGRTGKKILPKFILSDNTPGNEVFCVRFSPDDSYVAGALGSGIIKIYATNSGKHQFTLNTGSTAPTTQLRWRPHTNSTRTKNVLISVNADGVVQHWHITSGKCLHQISEEGNQLFCIDYMRDGSQFAVAGKNREIHVYDEATKQLVTKCEASDSWGLRGHANRVFSLKCHPTEPHTILSGGWDNTVQIWDVRTGSSVRSIYGPFICGDALDVSEDGNTVLTGSWRTDKQLQLWDFKSGQLISDIPWKSAAHATGPAGSVHNPPDACMLYTAQFAKNATSNMIVAGGSGANEAKLFDRDSGNVCFGTITSMSKGCYSADFSNDTSMVAVAGGDGAIRIMNVTQ
eukprot:GDKI01021449.1.p1 GENE.GDKI01021449.1~~GDKI01021449.1.p1  ORF type:complete len:385 (+),score=92.15 GDKI01021449.1:75-1229(+)